MVEFGQSGCIQAKVVVNGKKWLYSGRSGYIRAEMVVFGKSCFIRAIRMHSGKNGCIRARWPYLGKSGSIQAKVVVFGQKW